jgi:hypothetical protein
MVYLTISDLKALVNIKVEDGGHVTCFDGKIVCSLISVFV